MTRYALGVWLGAAVLGVHGLVLLGQAADVLGMPIEEGGLFFGPFFGLPALTAGCGLLACAVVLALVEDWRMMPVVSLVVVTVADALLAWGGGPPTLVLGALAGARRRWGCWPP